MPRKNMKTTTPMSVFISTLMTILAVQAGPLSNRQTAAVVSSSPQPSFTALAIPLINHNNGQFWSTPVQVEGTPSGGIDTALDTGGGLFIIPSASAPPCLNGNCQRGTCK